MLQAPTKLVGDQPLYYVVLDGASMGPLTTSEFSRLIAEKRITRGIYIWKPGMADWQLAESVPEVLRLVAFTPPVPEE